MKSPSPLRNKNLSFCFRIFLHSIHHISKIFERFSGYSLSSFLNKNNLFYSCSDIDQLKLGKFLPNIVSIILQYKLDSKVKGLFPFFSLEVYLIISFRNDSHRKWLWLQNSRDHYPFSESFI